MWAERSAGWHCHMRSCTIQQVYSAGAATPQLTTAICQDTLLTVDVTLTVWAKR